MGNLDRNLPHWRQINWWDREERQSAGTSLAGPPATDRRKCGKFGFVGVVSILQAGWFLVANSTIDRRLGFSHVNQGPDTAFAPRARFTRLRLKRTTSGFAPSSLARHRSAIAAS